MDMQRTTYANTAMSRLMDGEEDMAGVVDRAIQADEVPSLGQMGGLYVFRPVVPAVPDRTLAALDFITDGTWRLLDLADVIPVDACCVMCYVRVEDNVANDILFRRPGGVGVESCLTSITPGRPIALTFPVNAGGARAIEYNAANTVWTLIELTVVGWFAPPTW